MYLMLAKLLKIKAFLISILDQSLSVSWLAWCEALRFTDFIDGILLKHHILLDHDILCSLVSDMFLFL